MPIVIKTARRSVLRGLGGALAALGLPPLEIALNTHGTARADGSALPLRFGVFWWGCGVLSQHFDPRDTGPNWTLSTSLQPLAAVKPSIAVITGMRYRTAPVPPHYDGTSGLLCGATPVIGGGAGFPLPSIDVIAARSIGNATKFRSLEFGVSPTIQNEGPISYAISHNSSTSANLPELSPQKMFDRLFPVPPGMGVDPAAQKLRLAARKSVLDTVKGDVEALRNRVGTGDRHRLDDHLDGIRVLEREVASIGDVPASACSPLARPEAIPAAPFYYAPRNKVMSDLLIHALLCDKTRVFTYSFSEWHTPPFADVGGTQEFHSYTHDEGSPQPMVQKHVMFIMQQLGLFLEKLQAARVGAGSLLDSCAILCSTEVREGKIHQHDPPIIVAGNAGGSLRTGFHYRSKDENPSTVALTLLRSVGVNADGFGQGECRSTQTFAPLMV